MANPMKTDAISKFLGVKAPEDLAALYDFNMECQVNVAQDGGDRVENEYRGRKWHGWTDGLSTWKSFRIPYKAATDPEYEDKPLSWDLAQHAEAIGMTGWDWQNLRSRWVAFDFDAISGHSEAHAKKLTSAQLDAIKNAACDIPWVTVRRSTSGSGLHLYVFCDVETHNHHEHAALARAILGRMAAVTGHDFASQVDICGGNMWVWHRKMKGTNGLELIKQGESLIDIPPNWRDHLTVIKGKSKRCGTRIEKGTSFEDLVSQRTKTDLDEHHRALLTFLQESNAQWWWDQDHNMLVTHTFHLNEAFNELDIRGFFATGTTHSSEVNCFLFPVRGGGWSVRRFSPGVAEHDSWTQDGAGWTHCYFNRDPDVGSACRATTGIEDTTGAYEFREAPHAVEAARLLGVEVKLPVYMASRRASIKRHKDGRLIFHVNKENDDKAEHMHGWLVKKDQWVRIFNARTKANNKDLEPEVGNFDDVVRHIVTPVEDAGWVVQAEGVWRLEPMNHIRIALSSMGMSTIDVSKILGNSIFKPWTLVNKPFEPEYPGERQWNRLGAQLKHAPSEGQFKTWQKILDHIGTALDEAVKTDPWCCVNGITRGADYLLCWVASLFQHPTEPLPYLFMYGPQDSGKSVFHEALSILFTKGYINANAAMENTNSFNGEMDGAVLCYVEEKDLSKNPSAYNKIKEWVTSIQLLVHTKGKTPVQMPNTTHWVHCANDHNACPVFPGDTRVTMLFVDSIDPLDLIPKRQLLTQLDKEAPAFLHAVFGLDLPDPTGRLHIPIIQTEDKHTLEANNQSPIDAFIADHCQPADGYLIKYADFYARFERWIDPVELSNWGKKRVGRSIPPQYSKGRQSGNNQVSIGNITWKETEVEDKGQKFRLVGETLKLGDK